MGARHGLIDGQPNAILGAVEWVQAVLLGPVALSIAVIAVAFVGFAMLSGRTNVRRGATIILGCFIVFGSASIAQGLRGLADSGSPRTTYRAAAPDPIPALEPPAPAPAVVSDPYAGAALRR